MSTIDVKDAAGATVALEKPLAPGGALAAASRPVTIATDDPLQAKLGVVTETAPATDTASSGLNGRLQRIAQRITSLIALFPSSIGQKTAAGSLSITHASDDAVLALFGAVTETAPANDTASSGLNGRLQRIAQRLTTLLTGIVLAAGSAIIGKVGIDQTVGQNIVLPQGTEYETVAASATDQALGATGATGDLLVGLLIIPATTSPGAVSIKDGAGSAITVFTGGAASVSNLVPFYVPLGLKSVSGAWKVTTGTNVSAIGIGDFT